MPRTVADARVALIALAWVTNAAVAGEPVTGTLVAPAAAPSSAVPARAVQVLPISQEALLARQARHPDRLFVLDVRTPEEFASGHVPGAVNVPLDQIPARLGDVPTDKDVVLYCRTGRRAAMAADVLAAHGYTRLAHLEGDMNRWAEQGRPIER